MRLPVRLSIAIPLLVALAGLASGAVAVAVDLHHVVSDAVTAATSRARLMSEFTSGEIESAYRRGEPQRTETILGRLASDPLLLAAALVDQNDTVRYANLLALKGRDLTQTALSELASLADTVRGTRSLRTRFDPGGDRLFALQSVVLRQNFQGPVASHLGVLILQHDLRPVRTDALRQAYQHAGAVALPTLLFSLLTGIAFHLLFTRRARRLLLQTAEIAKGHLEAARVLPGSDEVAELSVSISEMARELRRRSRTQALMMAELDHRVKNTLASVLSLMDQTAHQTASLKEFLAMFGGRVRSMARTHEVLAASKWVGLGVEELLRLTAVRSLPVERVHLEGEPVTLAPRVATPLGLVFHELATNAMKYGAFAEPAGTLSLGWSQSGGAGNAWLLDLIWEEHTPARAAEAEETSPRPLKEGLGLTLVRGLIEHEIGGRVAFEHAPSGFRCWMAVYLDAEEGASDAV